MKNLADRVAWITGAASGIGLALAHRLAAEQMKLVLVDVEAGPLEAADRAAREGRDVLALRCDVSKATECRAAAKRARDVSARPHHRQQCRRRRWWRPDVDAQRGRLEMDDRRQPVGRHPRHSLLLGPLVASGEEGHVVNTASIAGLTSTPFMGPYTATKHAVVALSECLAKELELAQANVGVSVLCPGFVKTQHQHVASQPPARQRTGRRQCHLAPRSSPACSTSSSRAGSQPRRSPKTSSRDPGAEVLHPDAPRDEAGDRAPHAADPRRAAAGYRSYVPVVVQLGCDVAAVAALSRVT